MLIEIIVGIILAISLVNLIINILVLKKVKFNEFRFKNQMGQNPSVEGIVFCRKCNNRYAATLQKCPACGEPRR